MFDIKGPWQFCDWIKLYSILFTFFSLHTSFYGFDVFCADLSFIVNLFYETLNAACMFQALEAVDVCCAWMEAYFQLMNKKALVLKLFFWTEDLWVVVFSWY